jgi:hypothetical protein
MADAANPESSDLQAEFTYIRQLAIDLRNVLKQQREALQEQGFRLPPGTTTTPAWPIPGAGRHRGADQLLAGPDPGAQ